jgi:hypothetical protein
MSRGTIYFNVKDIELFLEWLYWTGELKDVETGNLYGVQYTLFQQNLQPGLIGQWGGFGKCFMAWDWFSLHSMTAALSCCIISKIHH